MVNAWPDHRHAAMMEGQSGMPHQLLQVVCHILIQLELLKLVGTIL